MRAVQPELVHPIFRSDPHGFSLPLRVVSENCRIFEGTDGMVRKSAREYSSRIEVGMVGVNVGVAAPMAFFPFAGWKNSFFGDLHAHGKDAVGFYTEQKVIMSRWF